MGCSYRFGRLTAEGERHTKDVILREGCGTPWWREQGHSVSEKDLEILLNDPPEVLVIGTGAFGMMSVPEATRRALEDRGIRLFIERSSKAVKAFEQLSAEGADVALAVHLTC